MLVHHLRIFEYIADAAAMWRRTRRTKLREPEFRPFHFLHDMQQPEAGDMPVERPNKVRTRYQSLENPVSTYGTARLHSEFSRPSRRSAITDLMAAAASVARLEPYGLTILICLLIVLPLVGAQLGIDLDVVSRALAISTGAIVEAILHITGNI